MDCPVFIGEKHAMKRNSTAEGQKRTHLQAIARPTDQQTNDATFITPSTSY